MNTARTFFNRLNTDRAEAERSNRIINRSILTENAVIVAAGRTAAARLIRSRYAVKVSGGAWSLTNPMNADDCASGEIHLLSELTAGNLTVLGSAAGFDEREYEFAVDELLKSKRGSN